MSKIFLLIFLFVTALLYSCSKKHHPGKTPVDDNASSIKKNDSVLTKKTAKPKYVIPKVIAVNDKAARRSVDGRYYYDLLGHRYWRNNKDGKYYLFNKSMYTNDAFKPPVK